MHYKTIVLEMLLDRPETYETLRHGKRLLPATDAYAIELKTLHQEWKNRLAMATPNRDARQIASEALELAIEEFQKRLPCESPKDEVEIFSLDAAMNYIRRHSPAA